MPRHRRLVAAHPARPQPGGWSFTVQRARGSAGRRCPRRSRAQAHDAPGRRGEADLPPLLPRRVALGARLSAPSVGSGQTGGRPGLQRCERVGLGPVRSGFPGPAGPPHAASPRRLVGTGLWAPLQVCVLDARGSHAFPRLGRALLWLGVVCRRTLGRQGVCLLVNFGSRVCKAWTGLWSELRSAVDPAVSSPRPSVGCSVCVHRDPGPSVVARTPQRHAGAQWGLTARVLPAGRRKRAAARKKAPRRPSLRSKGSGTRSRRRQGRAKKRRVRTPKVAARGRAPAAQAGPGLAQGVPRGLWGLAS